VIGGIITRLPPKVMCSGSRDLFNVWEMSDNISETVRVVAVEDD